MILQDLYRTRPRLVSFFRHFFSNWLRSLGTGSGADLSRVQEDKASRTALFDSPKSSKLSPLSNQARIPHHVAIIMDGNRRWAREKHLPIVMGHWKGAEATTKIIRAAADAGVKVLTLWALSTENWRRSEEEIEALMRLLKSYLLQQKEQMISEGVKLDAIGDLSRFPEDVREVFEETKRATSKCNRIELVLALNYGGRDDIRRGVVSLLDDYKAGKIDQAAVSEQLISSYLDTSKWKDPELLIRTSGEQRLSNFLLWQVSYSEIYITDVLWPDFDENEFLKAIAEYQQRERRMGK